MNERVIVSISVCLCLSIVGAITDSPSVTFWGIIALLIYLGCNP